LSFYSFLGALVLLAVSGFLLSSFGWRGAPLFGIFGVLLFFGRAVRLLFPAVSLLLEKVPNGETYVATAVKILGVCYLGSITSDICHDLCAFSAERASLSAARVEIILLTLPFFLDILETGVSLL